LDNWVITWETIKKISPQLCSEIKIIIKDKIYQSVTLDEILKIINDSEEIIYLLNNFEEYEEAIPKIIEILKSLLIKNISSNISKDNLEFLINFVKSHEKEFKNKHKGLDTLSQLFDTLELEPEIDLLISIYDNIEIIKNIIDSIAATNLDKIKNGTFTFSNKNNLLSDFIEVYFLKNDIEINLDFEEQEIDDSAKFETENYNAFQSDLANQIIVESKKYPVLNQEEIRALIEKAQNGSRYAMEKAVLHNQKFVIKIVHKYLRNKVEFVDLFQEGCIGLTKAIEKFDLSKNFSFSTYAYWWIRQAITRAIADQSRLIRIPVYMTEKLSKYQKIKSELYEKLNREPSIKELAKAMHCKEDTILELIEFGQDAVSFNTKVGDEEDSELVDFIGSDTDVEFDYENSAFKDNVTNFISSLNLNERQTYIALHRFDIPGYQKETLDVIGKKFNITRERIRQLEKKVKRNIFCSNKAKEFCELFPDPEKAYKYVLEERKKFYSQEEEETVTYPNLALKIGATIERMNELISQLNSNDQKFIATHYDDVFNPIKDSWETYDDQKLKSIITKIKLIIKKPNYKPKENCIENTIKNANLTKEILFELTPKLAIVDQEFMYSIFDEEYNLLDVTLNQTQQNQLIKIIKLYKKMLSDPNYDPKAQTNLANILEISYEELDELTESLSKNIQHFLMKHYDENWNEKTRKSTEEKLETNKIIKLLLKIKNSQQEGLIKQDQVSSNIRELTSLELIITMGLISGNKYDIKYIAEFLNLEETYVIEVIREKLMQFKSNSSSLINSNYILARTKKDKVEGGE